MAQFESGHTQNLVRRGRLPFGIGDQIEGRHVPVTSPKKEPELIRQKRPPVSVQDAKPVVDKTKVKCRQIVQAGRPKVVFLSNARSKFHSHHMKCQECRNHALCAGA